MASMWVRREGPFLTGTHALLLRSRFGTETGTSAPSSRPSAAKRATARVCRSVWERIKSHRGRGCPGRPADLLATVSASRARSSTDACTRSIWPAECIARNFAPHGMLPCLDRTSRSDSCAATRGRVAKRLLHTGQVRDSSTKSSANVRSPCLTRACWRIAFPS